MSEFKTESRVKTATKYNSANRIKTGTEYSLSSKDIDTKNLPDSHKELDLMIRSLGIQTKAKSKSGKKSAITNYLTKDKAEEKKVKTLDDMNNAELRIVAKRYNLPHSGKKATNKALKQNIRQHMKENQIDEKSYFRNTETGSETSAIFEEEGKYTMVVSDMDVEPHKDVKVIDTGGGVHIIEQETMLGEKETIQVQITDNPKGYGVSQIQDSKTDIMRTDIDQRGYRGNHAENEVIAAHSSEAWDVIKRPSRGHDIIVKKGGYERYYDVKEINEYVDKGEGREHGRVQIDKQELKKIENWEKQNPRRTAGFIIKVSHEDGSSSWKWLDIPKAKKLLRKKKYEGKIPYTEIEKLPNFTFVSMKEISPFLIDRAKESKRSGAITRYNVHQVDKANSFIPVQSFDFPKSWKKEKKAKEDDLHREYERARLAPFFNTIKFGDNKYRSANVLLPLKDIRRKAQSVAIAVEKPNHLTAQERDIFKYGSFGGQNIQAKTDGQTFRGFYFQDAEPNEIKHFFIADEIRVDADDTGHYLALMNQIYTNHKPKVILFGGKEGEIDELRAFKFMGKQILSSLSYQRNKAIQDALTESLAEVGLRTDIEIERETYSPLAFRDSSGTVRDLSVSEEQLAIAHQIYKQPVTVVVDLVDTEADITFEYHGEDLDQTKVPELRFELIGGDIKPLNSDDLLFYAVNRMKMEPDSAQNMFEALYQQGWINYPRTDTVKAEEEPIYLLRKLEDFQGTEQERKLLEVVDTADKAYKAEQPFLQEGIWHLIQGSTQLSKAGRKLADEPDFYTAEGFDIKIERGLNPSDLTTYLLDNEITTPATRSAIVASLKEAGIVNLDKDRKYQIDRRGVYFASAYQFFEQNKIETSIDLKKKITQAPDIPTVQFYVNSYDLIDRNEMKTFIKAEAKKLLEQQTDLATLDKH